MTDAEKKKNPQSPDRENENRKTPDDSPVTYGNEPPIEDPSPSSRKTDRYEV